MISHNKMFFKVLLFIFIATISIPTSDAATDKVVCFFASWAGYRPGDGSYKPENINANLCTHVLYAFLGVDSTDGKLSILDPWNEIDLHSLEYVQDLKLINPDLKVLISIGGWNAGHEILSGVIASSRLRANLIADCINFFETWNYDGIDIDWEYPQESDKEDFVKLLQEMRQAFDAQGYIISVTVAGTPLPGYNVNEITKTADLVNVLTYDFHTPSDGATGLNAPLYGSQSVNTSLNLWLAEGSQSEKLTIAVPFYGHSYALSNDASHDVGSPAGLGISGPLTKSPGVLGYNEICYYYNDWTQVWDDEAQVPHIYDGSNWVSFDDPKSIGLKAKFAKDNNLGGITVWSVDTDDFRGDCGTQDVLLQAIHDNFFK